MNKNQEIINYFWKTKHPDDDWVSKERLAANLEWIIPRIDKKNDFIMDIGCGSGELTLALLHFLNFSKCYLLDLNEHFLAKSKEKLQALKPNIEIECTVGDITELPQITTIDLCFCLGVIHYILDDEKFKFLLSKINCKQLFLRAPCTLKPKDEEICTYSDALQSEYAAKYRTLDNTISIINEFFKIKEYGRVFPDSIESKFGTKQFMFNCLKKNS